MRFFILAAVVVCTGRGPALRGGDPSEEQLRPLIGGWRGKLADGRSLDLGIAKGAQVFYKLFGGEKPGSGNSFVAEAKGDLVVRLDLLQAEPLTVKLSKDGKTMTLLGKDKLKVTLKRK
jgi:hypothetical protein